MIPTWKTIVSLIILLQAFTRVSFGKPTDNENQGQIADSVSELNTRELKEMEKETGNEGIMQKAREKEKEIENVTIKKDALLDKKNESGTKLEETKKSDDKANKKHDAKEEEVDGSDKKVEQLVKEKSELFKQINKAINESIILLNATNNTGTRIGMDFMLDLKGQLALINGTDLKFFGHKNEYIQRRNAPNKKKISLSFKEIADLFKKDGTTKNPLASKELANMLMQKQIENWIKQRQLEKKKIQEYQDRLKKAREGGIEKCPREGEGKKTIKEKGKKRGRYYPCCRKCCKRSYMGCL